MTTSSTNVSRARNVSGGTLRYWFETLELKSVSSPCQEKWRLLKEHLSLKPALKDERWFSDPLKLKSYARAGNGAEFRWCPPNHLSDWVVADAPEIDMPPTISARSQNATSSGVLSDYIANASMPDHDTLFTAINEYWELQKNLGDPYGPRTIIYNHVAAWLQSAVGGYITSAALTPTVELGVNILTPETKITNSHIEAEVRRRLQEFAFSAQCEPFVDPGTAILNLYNCRYILDGYRVGEARSGQSEFWRERWFWFSRQCDSDQALYALQLAGALLARPGLAEGVRNAICSDNINISWFALCVARRCLLTLKTMAWLEVALRQNWRHIRTKDLVAFASSAISPSWTSWSYSISHRSRDLKRVLIDSPLWGDPATMIDTRFIPTWETNDTMIWSLFSSSQNVCRISSSSYGSSLWCRRERELSNWLVSDLDFVDKRNVLDFSFSNFRFIRDKLLGKTYQAATTRPVECEVVLIPEVSELHARVLRAAALARRLWCWYGGDANTTNIVIASLAIWGESTPTEMPHPIGNMLPTLHDGGWRAYGKIFHEAAEAFGARLSIESVSILDPAKHLREAGFPIYIKEGMTENDLALELEYAESSFPDMRRSPENATEQFRISPGLGDILLANEFMRVVVPPAGSNAFLVDLRNVDLETWESGNRFSLARGLLWCRTQHPIWIKQSANQATDSWAYLGEKPVLTEHTDDQFAWMKIAKFHDDWFGLFQLLCKVFHGPQSPAQGPAIL